MAGAKESLCLGGLKSTGRCRRSEPPYFDVQVLWQAEPVGLGGGLGVL